MKIEVQTKLILTIPNPKKEESVGDIMLAAENIINRKCQLFIMLKTRTKVGIRIQVGVGRQIK